MSRFPDPIPRKGPFLRKGPFPRKWLGIVGGSLLIIGCSQPADDPSSATASDSGPTGGTATVDSARAGYYGYGTPATEAEIAGWDIDIRPDGLGLPEGSGSVEDGEWLYDEQCAECHGTFGEGVGRYPVLAGGAGTLRDARPNKTVGSYWAHTSTLFDYIRRTMPFTQPESLTDDETYALTAYVLYLNDLVDDDLVLSHENLASIRLPNADGFVPDPRPDVANVRCMENCRDAAAIQILSEAAPDTAGEPLEGGAAGGEEAHSVTDSVTDSVTAAVAEAHPGTATYDQYCSICHDVGVGGAPKLDDADAWVSRTEKGMPALMANAINGISSANGVMPAKGGFVHLSDEEVNAAVEYMVEASR